MEESNKIYYMLGICGSAMSSLALALKETGHRVIGSDENAYPPAADQLHAAGIKVLSPYTAQNFASFLQEFSQKNDRADLRVVVGNAISRGNPELEEILLSRSRYASMAETVKNEFLWDSLNVVIAGTHGKTTTSSMTAWILECAGLRPNFLIGGLPSDFSTGARFHPSDGKSQLCAVLEGDEYDSAFFDKRAKFLHYLPQIAVINNIEYDHADIYDSLDEIKLSFTRLLNNVPSSGKIFINGDDKNARSVAGAANCGDAAIVFVGTGEGNDIVISDLFCGANETRFHLMGNDFRLQLNGEFNARNAAMAICASEFCGVKPKLAASALETFRGVAKRQEYKGEKNGARLYDDFAHHPSAIKQVVDAMRSNLAGSSRLHLIFEPRSNTTRRNVFQNELAKSLALGDYVYITPINDEKKIAKAERLDLEKLVGDIKKLGAEAIAAKSLDEIAANIRKEIRAGDLILTLSNGSLVELHKLILS